MNETLYLSMHVSEPDSGDQSAGEIQYVGYERVVYESDKYVAFPEVGEITGGTVGRIPTVTVTHFAVGRVKVGAGEIVRTGPVYPPMKLAAGFYPHIKEIT